MDLNVNNKNGSGDKWNMYYGASPILFELAEKLRTKMTDAEELLWNVLKLNKWHLKFRRQHPLANYIADFYCHKLKMVIELDGGYHQNKEVIINDKAREENISRYGINVIRFKNEEVINDIHYVLSKIENEIHKIHLESKDKVESPNNSPLGDGGKTPSPSNSPEQILIKRVEDNVGSPNNSPLGDGGKTPLSKNSPLGDGSRGKLFVIKIGGNVIDDDTALQSFLKDFAGIKENKILVHGGGKIATKIGQQLGIEPNYFSGRRITDAATIDLVTMVYGGLVNKKIVAKLQSLHCNAIGLTGADANIIPATKRPVVNSPLGDGGYIDYGFVGNILPGNVGVENLHILLANNFVPIVAPLTHDGAGQMLNTNADTIASTLAVALSKNYDVRLIYCFEKKGVLENVSDEQSVINLITKEKYAALKAGNKLFDGILPKIDNAFAAIDNGVTEVLIGHANDLVQNTTGTAKGTLIK